ncbi:unnamed protein product [Tuber aestivum]|uniref:Superoxide dismutase copper/zinc binding domain-containing protein n=1 Tax=Tuber aestivum TaxID=59557 RepID=A0A292PZ02_9PEZI|nr:unnamed protein product [Tuber aestivum]
MYDTHKQEAAPSAIVSAIQDTGRDAIIRGSGKPNSAAVAILETHAKDIPSPVRGLVRMVQVSPKLTILDLTLQGLSPGRYHATIRTAGDISRGAASTGDIWGRQESGKEEEGDVPPRGELGSINVGKSGTASVLLDKPIEAWEIIGRSFVVSKERDGSFRPDGPDTIVGVIARSAGVWENEKTVCWLGFLAYLADLPPLPIRFMALGRLHPLCPPIFETNFYQRYQAFLMRFPDFRFVHVRAKPYGARGRKTSSEEWSDAIRHNLTWLDDGSINGEGISSHSC